MIDLTTTSAQLGYLSLWLDPVGNAHIDDADDDEVFGALIVMRQRWPELYADAVRRMRRERGEHIELNGRLNYSDDFQYWLLNQINGRVPGEMPELDWVLYGVPADWWGVDPLTPEFRESCAAAFVAELFGDLTTNASRKAAYKLIDSLEEQLHPDYRAVMWLLKWLFGCTNNEMLDNSEDDAHEMALQGHDWDSFHIALKIWEQADCLLDHAVRGRELLQTDDEFYGIFCSNLLIAYNVALQERFYDHSIKVPAFHWPRRPAQSSQRQTNDGAAVFPIRDGVAA